MTTVHEAMREARLEAGWTVRYLSDISGVHPNNIYQYETGKVIPSIYNLIDLTDALGLTLDEYVGHRVKDRRAGEEEDYGQNRNRF